MTNQDKILFENLKKEVAKIFLDDFPSVNPDISKWKGLDIVYFQESLRQKVKGNVSEKWFYTYFKSEFEKLPRIDMLNLLSQYAGYKRGWTEFLEYQKNTTSKANINPSSKNKNSKYKIQEEIIENSLEVNNDKSNVNNSKRNLYAVLSVFSLLLILFGLYKYYIYYKSNYTFCFYDSDRSSLIKSDLEVIIEKPGISPEYYKISEGCFSYRSTIDTLKMIVGSPYYKKDSFIVSLKQIREKGEENYRNFKLRPNDYAVMLYYYSTSLNSIDESKKAQFINQRKEELDKLIDNNALIYQVYDSEVFGVEVLDKKKYIDFMTTPTTSLKNYVLIASQVNKNNKISLIKFKIQKNEN